MVATASPVPTPPVSSEAPSPRGAFRPVPRGRLPAFALAALLLAGCGRAAGGGAALPAGCGPRAARAPATRSALPTAAGPVSSPQGAAVTAIAAGGGRLFASSYNAADGRRLFTSVDGGELWRPLALPSGVPPGWSLQPLALSPGGHSLAGVAVGRLFLGGVTRAGVGRWRASALRGVTALAWAPGPAGGLAALVPGAMELRRGGTWLRVGLPAPAVGAGRTPGALALWRGGLVAAVGGQVALLPSGARQARVLPPLRGVLALADGPRGALYALTATTLRRLAAPAGAAWTTVPLPAGARPAGVAPLGAASLLLLGSPDGAWLRGASGAWRRLRVPGFPAGAPVPAGGVVWLPTTLGPVRVGPSGAARASGAGIPAPVSVVGSAAWEPARVVTGWSGGLFVSANGARTFRSVTPPLPDLAATIASASWTADGSCLALVYAPSGLGRAPTAYLSGDGGRSWRAVSISGYPQDVWSLLEWPAASGVWWATLGGPAGGLYRSSPGRASWTRVALPGGRAWPAPLWPGRGGLWVGPPGGGGPAVLLRLPRGPAAWWDRLRGAAAPPPAVAPEWGAAGLAAVDPYDPRVLYAGDRRSTDGGRTWVRVGGGPGLDVGGARGFAFDPGPPGAALLTTAAAWRDTGRGWRQFWAAAGGQYATGIAGAGGDRFYLAVEHLGLSVVADPGARFRPVAPRPIPGAWSPPPPGSGPPPQGVVAPSDPRVVYRLVDGRALETSGDGGRHFGPPRPIAASGAPCCGGAGQAGPRVLAATLAVAPSAPGTVYVGLALSEPVGYRVALGLWVSTDGGRRWSRTGLPQDLAVTGIALPPGAPGTVVVAAAPPLASPAQQGLWRSTDGGRRWAPVAGLPGPAFTLAAVGGRRLLAGSAGALLRSADGGARWSRVPIAAPPWRGHGRVPGAAVDAVLRAPNGWLYAGSGVGGVRLSRDGGRTWQDIAMAVGDPPVEPGGLRAGPGGSVRVATDEGVFVFQPAG